MSTRVNLWRHCHHWLPRLFVGSTLCLVMLLAGVLSGAEGAVAQEQEGHVFSTWGGFEVDKCASIWLIRRFVDKNAVFRLYPEGGAIEAGIPFDTPDAQLRRYHNRSTFESIVAHYHIGHEKLPVVSKIVHDSEINIWGKKVMSETVLVEQAVNSLVKNAKNDEEVIEKCIEFFDALYNKMSAGSESP
jgi:hypothetical protein